MIGAVSAVVSGSVSVRRCAGVRADGELLVKGHAMRISAENWDSTRVVCECGWQAFLRGVEHEARAVVSHEKHVARQEI